MNDCRRILAVAPKAVVLTPYMLERQIKNGLNERCRVYARTIDFTEPIEHIFQELTLQDSEWLQERGHPQPGLLQPAKATAGAAHAASHAHVGESPAEMCSFCRDPHHCVDKCRKKAKVLAAAQDAMEADRVAARKKSGTGKGSAKDDSSGSEKKKKKKEASKKGDAKKGDKKQGERNAFCFDFQRGQCTRGAACKYPHVAAPAAGAVSTSAAAASTAAADNNLNATDALAIAKLMERAEGNRELQAAIHRRVVDEGWTHSARAASQYSRFNPAAREIFLVDSARLAAASRNAPSACPPNYA
jgi:hypothetical protein